jgi:riboflavin kinase / FMN adenylyltransferase
MLIPCPGDRVKLIRHLDHLPEDFRHSAVAIGNFDGVHVGHARIIERLIRQSRRLGDPAVVLTFDPPPARLLHPQAAPPPLTWTDRKVELLGELGIDFTIAYPTDLALLQLSAREFFDRIVRGRLDARAMVEGENFFFGHGREGNVEMLRQFCTETGVELEIVEPVAVDGQIVSSSRIRGLVAEGRMELVRRMLTRPYRIRGTVVRGAGRGAGLGFPTANLDSVLTLLPAEGIYAGRAWADGALWPAAISLGPNPTFNEGSRKIEVHLIGYRGLLYGRAIEVDFLARLREVVRFESVDQLIAQMDRDIATVQQVVTQCEASV